MKRLTRFTARMLERNRGRMGSAPGIFNSSTIPGLSLPRLMIVLVILSIAIGAEAQTVYVTRTGSKYHRGDCRYLHSSKIETKLTDAKANYTPCSVCKPPTEVKTKEAGSSASGSSQETKVKISPAKSTKTLSPTTSKQCSEITKSGMRCKRVTSNANRKCWQHQ
jgi:hypothetical protein